VIGADRAHMQQLETENLARLQELATGNRVTVEV
jgi:hypothetical protein